jgi:hypothetical protein
MFFPLGDRESDVWVVDLGSYPHCCLEPRASWVERPADVVRDYQECLRGPSMIRITAPHSHRVLPALALLVLLGVASVADAGAQGAAAAP